MYSTHIWKINTKLSFIVTIQSCRLASYLKVVLQTFELFVLIELSYVKAWQIKIVIKMWLREIQFSFFTAINVPRLNQEMKFLDKKNFKEERIFVDFLSHWCAKNVRLLFIKYGNFFVPFTKCWILVPRHFCLINRCFGLAADTGKCHQNEWLLSTNKFCKTYYYKIKIIIRARIYFLSLVLKKCWNSGLKNSAMLIS
jgi:hypothetical protein